VKKGEYTHNNEAKDLAVLWSFARLYYIVFELICAHPAIYGIYKDLTAWMGQIFSSGNK
jgi:hypothetical protein